MDEIYELKEKLLDELREYGKKEMTAGSLDVVDKLAHSVKNLCKVIEDMEGYSNMNYRDNSYRDGRMGGRSYARGRRRDSMGRYSREDGYSYHDDMAEELKELMHDAPESIKGDLKRLITKVESM